MLTKNRSFKTLGAIGSRNAAVAAPGMWRIPNGLPSDLDGCSADDDCTMPTSVHWRNAAKNTVGEVEVRLPHAAWSVAERAAVAIEHVKPEKMIDRAACSTVWVLRRVYDLATGYTFGKRNEACMVRRVIFLETVAAVPGMVAAAIRHLRSLRYMKKDYGWIHTLLEEAENERMHLMTALMLYNNPKTNNKPTTVMKAAVMAAQALFLAWYTAMYAIAPRYCHRFVGYLEEEAVKTYTGILKYQDDGLLPAFDVPAPKACRAYYALPDNATLRDVWECIRADEAHHREVNHTFADLTSVPNAVNPFPPGY